MSGGHETLHRKQEDEDKVGPIKQYDPQPPWTLGLCQQLGSKTLQLDFSPQHRRHKASPLGKSTGPSEKAYTDSDI